MGISGSGTRGALSTVLCGVAIIAFGPIAAGARQTGRVTGQVTTVASAPLPLLEVTTNQEVCGQTVPDEALLVDAAGGLANAVVTLVGLPARDQETVPVVSNEGCRFRPRVLVLRPGGEVQVTSADQVLHTSHAYADDDRSLFNVAIPMPGITITRQITGKGIIRLVCDTHTWMRGYIVATDDRSVVTASDGSFIVEDVPPGTYEVRVWHERLASPPQTVTVAAGASAPVTVAMTETTGP